MRACAWAVLLALIAGCGGSSSKPRAAPHAAARPQTVSERCGPPDAPARTIRFKTQDGATLTGAIAGSGPVGVVLIHEYPGPMCGWWPYAAYLARHHGKAASRQVNMPKCDSARVQRGDQACRQLAQDLIAVQSGIEGLGAFQ